MLDNFIVKMTRSKHDDETRCLVLKAGLRGYFEMVEVEVMGLSKVIRLSDEGKREREIRKILGSTVWYQPNNLQSPGVLKDEEVAVTSKTRSAHSRGKGGLIRGIRPVGRKSSQFESIVFVHQHLVQNFAKSYIRGKISLPEGKG